jgi:hypothetical protein
MPFPLPEAPVAGVTLQHHDDHVYVNKLTNSTINSQSGTSYTLVLGDMFKVIETTSSSSVSVTVPPNSSVAFPVGTVVEVAQLGTGVVTVVQGSGVTINTPGTLVLRAQYSNVVLRKRASDTWVLAGDTT